MSFFVSDSLKGVISQEDLAAGSPIRIIEEKEFVQIILEVESDTFKVDLIEASFSDKLDKIVVATDAQGLVNIFKCNNQNLEYSIHVCNNQYMQSRGIFVLNKLESNKEDNYVTCKIDIYKRGLNV